MTETSGRLLQLLSLLQTRRDWPGEELARRLEVSGRTVRRDIGRLRDLGYPVEATTGPDGGYRLQAGTAMPPLLLDDEEAVAIAVGLRAAAGTSVAGIEETSVRALVKLEQVLPAHLRRRVQALTAATVTLGPAGPQVDPGALSVIAAACRDHERLRFAYEAKDGARTRREVEPHSLVNLGRRWYLAAWDTARQDWRTFRLDRLERPAPAGGRFSPRTVPGGDAAAWVASNLRGGAPRHEVHLTVHLSAAALRARVGAWSGPPPAITPIDDGRCSYRTGDESLDWLAVRLGMLGADFEVHEPAALREHLGRLAVRYAAAAAGQ